MVWYRLGSDSSTALAVDIEGGRWFMILPSGVSFRSGTGGVISTRSNIVALDSLHLFTKGRLIFKISLQVHPGAPSRLVFRSFLNDLTSNCEAAHALTVSLGTSFNIAGSAIHSMTPKMHSPISYYNKTDHSWLEEAQEAAKLEEAQEEPKNRPKDEDRREL